MSHDWTARELRFAIRQQPEVLDGLSHGFVELGFVRRGMAQEISELKTNRSPAVYFSYFLVLSRSSLTILLISC